MHFDGVACEGEETELLYGMKNFILSQRLNFEGKNIRMIGTADNPEWVARDVCDALGILDASRAVADFYDDEKGITLSNTLGGSQSLLTVTESGLCRLIFQSNKPEAERFRIWIFQEVLPSIRKTGGCQAVSRPELSLHISQAKKDLELKMSKIEQNLAQVIFVIHTIEKQISQIQDDLRKLSTT